jgi:serine/threonine-protein phosphatase 2A regulatory subunit B
MTKDGKIVIPRAQIVNEDWEPYVRKSFEYGHNYHINSLSLSTDGENFISSDDLRVNLWNIEQTKTAFAIVDIKPPVIDELNEVITHSEFHPTHPDVFLFSSSKGTIHICDLRINSEFEKCAQRFEIYVDPAKKHFFTEIINSISYGIFSKNGQNIYSRDYITSKIWDIRNPSKPMRTI